MKALSILASAGLRGSSTKKNTAQQSAKSPSAAVFGQGAVHT
jgi:hypothetical protein